MMAQYTNPSPPTPVSDYSLNIPIMEHKDDLKGSSVNKVLRMWPAHFQQFTKMSDADRDVVQIADPQIVQAKIDSQPREKAFQAAAEEKVTFGQLGIWQGSREDISAALDLVEEVKAAVDKLELGQAAKKLHRYLHMATRSLNSAWDHTQIASFANAGIRYAGVAGVDVEARAVHSGLCTLQAQAVRVGTYALPHQAD